MKLIQAGANFLPIPYESLLYNCTRNKACQDPYYVPVQSMSDIVFYINVLGLLPQSVEIQVFNACDLTQIPGTAIAGSYVFGRKPEGESNYGVLGNLTVIPPAGVTYQRFFFKVTLVHSFVFESYYFSEVYEIDSCNRLTEIVGCYPDEPSGTMAYDCNDVYYGFPPDGYTFIGDETYRYYHRAFVRNAEVIEQDNKLQVVRFKSKRAYRTTLNRSFLFQFEYLPTFYKDVIVAMFMRGNVTVGERQFVLAEEQSWTITDDGSKKWNMDTVFDSECKQSFGCAVSLCLPPVPTCCDPHIDSANVVFLNCSPPVFNDTVPPATQGVNYFQPLTINGSYPMILNSTIKPDWLTVSFNQSNGTVTLSGTPPAAGSFNIILNITNCTGQVTVNVTLTLVVAA